MAPLGLVVGALGIGNQPQVAQGPPQPRRIQPPGGGLQQHRLGLRRSAIGEVVGAMGQHRGVGDRELPGAQRLGGPGQGPRNSERAVRTALAAAPAPMRSRPRSQLAVEGAWTPWSAPAAPRASTAARCWSH